MGKLACFEGGEAGGVAGVLIWEAGAGPGEQYGICLFSIGVALILDVSRVSSEARGGGVRDCRRGACCYTTSVAIYDNLR